MRRIGVLLAVVLTLTACTQDRPRMVPKEYCSALKKAARERLEINPKLLAAQIDQESGFDPDAVSKAGAEGIAQFIPTPGPCGVRTSTGTVRHLRTTRWRPSTRRPG
ncbi:MAG: transglycosylase SLT domain-containing protein [Candidatus Nanopelagicales bacterium]